MNKPENYASPCQMQQDTQVGRTFPYDEQICNQVVQFLHNLVQKMQSSLYKKCYISSVWSVIATIQAISWYCTHQVMIWMPWVFARGSWEITWEITCVPTRRPLLYSNVSTTSIKFCERERPRVPVIASKPGLLANRFENVCKPIFKIHRSAFEKCDLHYHFPLLPSMTLTGIDWRTCKVWEDRVWMSKQVAGAFKVTFKKLNTILWCLVLKKCSLAWLVLCGREFLMLSYKPPEECC